MAGLHIGLSGYSYPEWRGEDRFFPPDVKQAKFLEYYASRYPAVEMDSTWYQMPGEKAVADWASRTPEHFKFTFKMHRKVSHLSRLKPDCIDAVKFFMSRLVPVADKGRLGAVYFQLPPNFKRNDERIEEFFDLIPKDFGEIKDGTAGMRIPWAIEFRHETWNQDAVEEILRKHGIVWVASDMEELDAVKRDTGDFMYTRLRKLEYSDEKLKEWSSYFQEGIQKGKECYVFCKHEDEGSPWIWADAIMNNIGG